MKRLHFAFFTLAIPLLAKAGVTLEMVSKDLSGNETERSQIYAQDGFLRLDSDGGPYAGDVTLIFDGTRFLVMDHGEKSYVVMDEAMLTRMTEKMNDAMAQMKAQLAQLPPDQRAMAEQMMQGQMQAMMGNGEPAPPPRVEATGSGEWQGRACAKYDVYENDVKTQEICSAPLDQVDGAAEMMETFQGMAGFVKKLSQSLPDALSANFNDYPGMVAELIGGFPIHTIEYRKGRPDSEVSMESIREEPIDPSRFEVPGDYRLEDPFAGR